MLNRKFRSMRLRFQKTFVFMMVVWLWVFCSPVWAEEATLRDDVRMLTGLCFDAINDGNSSTFGDWQFSETVGTNERRPSPDRRFRVFFGPALFRDPPAVELHNCIIRFEGLTGSRLNAVHAVGDAVASLIGTEVGGFSLTAGRNTHATQTPRATACVNGYTVEVIASIGLATDYAEAVMLKVGYSFFDPGACW